MEQFVNQYTILFNKAKTDFNAARLLYTEFLNGHSEIDLEVVFFHLQQSAEKCLKAILSKNLVNFPKVHDLELLVKLVLQAKNDLKIDVDLLTELSDFAVEGRYAIIHDDLENTEAYFDELENLLLKANRILSQ
jgi:HEPN domain-containing protein